MWDYKILLGVAALINAGAAVYSVLTGRGESDTSRAIAINAAAREDWHTIKVHGIADFSMGPLEDEEEIEDDEETEDEDEDE